MFSNTHAETVREIKLHSKEMIMLTAKKKKKRLGIKSSEKDASVRILVNVNTMESKQSVGKWGPTQTEAQTRRSFHSRHGGNRERERQRGDKPSQHPKSPF